MSPFMKSLYRLAISIVFVLTVSRIHAQEAKLVIPMGHAQQINWIEVNHDFTLMATSDDSNVIHIWDTKSNREILQLNNHPKGIVKIDFHPSKNELVSSDVAGNIFFWNVLTEEVIHKIKTQEAEPIVKYGPAGKHVYYGGKELVKLQLENHEVVQRAAIDGTVTALDFSKSHNSMVIGTSKGNILGWSVDNGEETLKMSGHPVAIRTFGSYPSERSSLVVGYSDGFIDVVEPEGGQVLSHEKKFSHAVNKVMTRDDGGIIAVGADDKEDVQFFEHDLKDDDKAKFRWSSTPFDETGIKGIAWKNDQLDEFFIANHGNSIHIWSVNEREMRPTIIKGTARPIYDIDTDGDGEYLIIGSRHGQIKVIDMTGAHGMELLRGMRGGGVTQLAHHPYRPIVLAAGRGNEDVKVWNVENQKEIRELRNVRYPEFPIEFLSDNEFFRKIKPAYFEKYNFDNGSKNEIKLQGVIGYKLNPNGTDLLFQMSSELLVYDAFALTRKSSLTTGALSDFTFSGNSILTISKGIVKIFQDGLEKKKFETKEYYDRIQGLSNGSFIVYSSILGESGYYTASIYSGDGQNLGSLTGHHDYITKVLEVQDRILTASLDGSIKIWSLNDNYKELGSIIPLRLEDYVVITPDDLFDATPNAINQMHFTVGGEIIALDQLKEGYYEPNLLPKLLGFDESDLKKPLDISQLGKTPSIEMTNHPNANNGVLSLKVSNNGGGIGRVVLRINGKEVATDVRKDKNPQASSSEVEYDVKGHPYLYTNKPSKVSIKVYNGDGNLGSEPKNIFVLPFGAEVPEEQPKIYAIVIGTSDYADDEMDLKYAAKDAEDFASALKISSSNLIGGQNIKMSVLTTNQSQDKWPTKDNIKAAFNTFANEAKARDYLIVYMAGHGVNSGGENGDFYYLTCTAEDGKVFNQEVREKHAVSSYEFTEYIKSVPALNQVMIVDACHSGTLTSAFGKKKPSKNMDAAEVKAYERMKDRTGIFLLAGSAADAVSYETTLYGQGLLTYALLFGMKGAALHEGEYIDVLDLFQYAAKRVPQLAEDIGGIQRPEVRVPIEAESFNIGKMTDSDKANIKLVQPKPVFVHTRFQEQNNFFDVLKLGKALDSRLNKVSKGDDAPILFMDKNHFSGALQVKGRYERKGQLTVVTVKVFEDDRLKTEFKVDGVNANTISDRIVNELIKIVQG